MGDSYAEGTRTRLRVPEKGGKGNVLGDKILFVNQRARPSIGGLQIFHCENHDEPSAVEEGTMRLETTKSCRKKRPRLTERFHERHPAFTGVSNLSDGWGEL